MGQKKIIKVPRSNVSVPTTLAPRKTLRLQQPLVFDKQNVLPDGQPRIIGSQRYWTEQTKMRTLIHLRLTWMRLCTAPNKLILLSTRVLLRQPVSVFVVTIHQNLYYLSFFTKRKEKILTSYSSDGMTSPYGCGNPGSNPVCRDGARIFVKRGLNM